jgi:prepilin-type N-terminal cleavage/methylation domain-containing protein
MPRTTTAPLRRTRESGFTVVEMMIALFIIVVLAIVAFKAFGGAKKATYANEAKTVGSAYMQSVAQYQADFANRNPTAAAWSGNNTTAAQRGPLNLTNQPYMKSVPEAVAGGRVGISVNSNCGTTASNPSGASTHTGWVSVCYGAEPQFYVRVLSRKDAGSPWAVCLMGATPATPKC